MGNDCCKTREKEEVRTYWAFLRPAAQLSLSRRSAIEALLQRLSLVSPPIRHPVLFRYDLVEVRRFLKMCDYHVGRAQEALLADLVRPRQRWRSKKPPASQELAAARRTKHVFFFETDFDQVPVLVVKGNPTLSACSEVLQHHLDSKLCSKVTVLLDADNSLPCALVLGLFSFFAHHYPGRLHRILVVRADLDSLTVEIRTRLRPFRRQLHICTQSYQETLTRYIPPERLLFEYGGLRKYRYDGGTGLRTSFARYERAALLPT